MTGLPSVACWRQSGPVSPKCLKQKQVSASNQRTHTILGKSPRDLCAVPLADYRLLGVGFPRRPAPLRGKPQASRQAQNLRCLVTATLPTKLGGLLKTPLRWSRIRAAISWPLHHRVAISNHRLVSFTHGQVTFRWRDSADNNKQKLLPLPVDEFLSRFLLHLLPQGFVRIRHLASWPADDALSSSRFAFSSWERHNNRLAKNILPPQRTPPTSTTALTAVDR